ncbi:prohibitin [Cordyceps javanica]|uniref:Prohibitin n=1 Tax=Cordyceps javanica TaxID=43265 RepID=A0A545VHV0_9HYPO|nr:prohibitin [Cordyceps javanica]
MDSKAPAMCRLCNVSLASPSVWRQHAKSDCVYNLRVKVAEPGTVLTPPSSSPRRQRSAGSSRHIESDDDASDASGSDYEDADSGSANALHFNSHHCLFCNTESASFPDSLQHMYKAHSFTIPFQEHLTVDVETVAAYLHLVIHGYRECIQCGCRRRTVEGIQHHMIAKGHCRFDVASDIEEFYEIPSQGYTTRAESLLLPSGKVLSNTTRADGPLASRRTPRSSTKRRMALTTLSSSKSSAQDNNCPPLSEHRSDIVQLSPGTELSRLSRGDQQSLAHLKDYQVRSLVATGARAVDEARREAKHSELKLSKAGNVTLMGTFRADTSKRFRGPWG